MADQAGSFGQDSPSQVAVDGQSMVHSGASSRSEPLLDLDARLDTLVQAVGYQIAQQFFWKAETDTIQTYEHRLTYRYVHVDSVTGQFYNQQRAPISADAALDHALPSLAVAPVQMALAPIVLEPYLSPFVRRSRHVEASDATGADLKSHQAPHPKNTWTSISARLRAKFHSLGNYAKTAAAPVQNHAAEADRPASELSVAAFTRRTA